MSDAYVLSGVHALLATAFIVAAFDDVRRWLRKKQTSSNFEMWRGDFSLGLLAAVYASVWAALLQLINVSEAWKGRKVLASVADTLVMGCLSFMSGWSRSRVLRVIGWWRERPE